MPLDTNKARNNVLNQNSAKNRKKNCDLANPVKKTMSLTMPLTISLFPKSPPISLPLIANQSKNHPANANPVKNRKKNVHYQNR
ncbi:MAG: hypothetical protein IJD23_07335 [Spirochaetaceae bacterium]|nr:hypothetical protein [Spirochaetaceae bacterium]